MMGIENVMDEIARYLGIDPLDVRKINFYGRNDRNVTPYRMTVEDNIIHELVDELEKKSDYRERSRQVRAFNGGSRILKRGIALTPVKFGISFTATFYNQAGALLHVYRDGSIMLNHGGTEMGAGVVYQGCPGDSRRVPGGPGQDKMHCCQYRKGAEYLCDRCLFRQ